MDIDDETAPLGAADVTPSPAPDASFIGLFEDVNEGAWYYDDVMYVANRGWMTGVSTTPMWFSPDGYLTRAMIVTTLYRIENSPDVTGIQNIFTDVAESMWYADALKWASANGIVLGYGNGLFGPEDPITFEQLATILVRYAEHINVTPPDLREYTGFDDDADIAYYAKDAVEQLYKARIIEGKLGNVLNPKENATRAEVAVLLRRFMEMVERATSF